LALWQKLATDWKINDLESYGTFVGLEDIIGQMDLILKGKTKGRVVVEF
jgi:acrylyl-CoA reductase (NADPH)